MYSPFIHFLISFLFEKNLSPSFLLSNFICSLILFCVPHIGEIIWHLRLCVGFISFNIIDWCTSIFLQMPEAHLSLWQSSTLLCIYNTFSFSIHVLMMFIHDYIFFCKNFASIFSHYISGNLIFFFTNVCFVSFYYSG